MNFRDASEEAAADCEGKTEVGGGRLTGGGRQTWRSPVLVVEEIRRCPTAGLVQGSAGNITLALHIHYRFPATSQLSRGD